MSKPAQFMQTDTHRLINHAPKPIYYSATYKIHGLEEILLFSGAGGRRVYVDYLFIDYRRGFVVHHEPVAGTAVTQKLSL